jgi:hypothetical protein
VVIWFGDDRLQPLNHVKVRLARWVPGDVISHGPATGAGLQQAQMPQTGWLSSHGTAKSRRQQRPGVCLQEACPDSRQPLDHVKVRLARRGPAGVFGYGPAAAGECDQTGTDTTGGMVLKPQHYQAHQMTQRGRKGDAVTSI